METVYQSIIYTCENGGSSARRMFWWKENCYDGAPYVNTTISFSSSNYSIHCDGSKSSEDYGMRIRTYQADASATECDTSSDPHTEDIFVCGICNYDTTYPSLGSRIFM